MKLSKQLKAEKQAREVLNQQNSGIRSNKGSRATSKVAENKIYA